MTTSQSLGELKQVFAELNIILCWRRQNLPQHKMILSSALRNLVTPPIIGMILMPHKKYKDKDAPIARLLKIKTRK